MRTVYEDVLISRLFEIKPGDFHAKGELDSGSVPLISCGEENNGLIGYFDIPRDKTYSHALTVSFNGFPLTTNFHPYVFGAKDDVAVLVPRAEMSTGVLIYVASLLNGMKWRYSYGRKCYRNKLEHVTLRLPVKKRGGDVDETIPNRLLEAAYEQVKERAAESVEALIQ